MSIQRYTPRLGENPVCRNVVSAIMEPDFYNGEWVKYSDHLATLAAIAQGKLCPTCMMPKDAGLPPIRQCSCATLTYKPQDIR